MRFEVVPCSVIRMLGGMDLMRMRQMGVMSGLVVVAGLMVLCCFCVVMGGHSMMVGCRLVMIRCLL
jgi:hypothetical protein